MSINYKEQNQPIDPKQFTKEQQRNYAYLLGLYLGDGCIYKPLHCKTAHYIKISLHRDETDIQRSAYNAMKSIFDGKSVKLVQSKTSLLTDVKMYHSELPKLFPQHGIGKKSSRKIKLVKWQEDILDKYSEYFVVGLWDADGTGNHLSYTKKGRLYSYLKYAFVNTSIDILNLFTKYCSIPHGKVKQRKRKRHHAQAYTLTFQSREVVAEFQAMINRVYSQLGMTLDERPLIEHTLVPPRPKKPKPPKKGRPKSKKPMAEYPYDDYRLYTIWHKKEGRHFAYLLDPLTDKRHTIALARYKMAVKLRRVLKEDEQVRHIDNDKTNDDIGNLQIRV